MTNDQVILYSSFLVPANFFMGWWFRWYARNVNLLQMWRSSLNTQALVALLKWLISRIHWKYSRYSPNWVYILYSTPYEDKKLFRSIATKKQKLKINFFCWCQQNEGNFEMATLQEIFTHATVSPEPSRKFSEIHTYFLKKVKCSFDSCTHLEVKCRHFRFHPVTHTHKHTHTHTDRHIDQLLQPSAYARVNNIHVIAGQVLLET